MKKKFVVISLVFIFACSKKTETPDFFDFENENPRVELGAYTIDYLLSDKIIFNKKEGDIRDTTLYDNKINELNFDGTYKLTNIANNLETYYFKFGFHGYYEGKTMLTYVNWLSKTPENG
ncbi:MAG: hypothetical protein COB73_08880, partial [Flavobacteriaceae bacterium]